MNTRIILIIIPLRLSLEERPKLSRTLSCSRIQTRNEGVRHVNLSSEASCFAWKILFLSLLPVDLLSRQRAKQR